MSDIVIKQNEVHAESAEVSSVPGHPREQLEIQEPETQAQEADDDLDYPTGAKLVMSMTSVFLTLIITGFDLTVVAATIPSLTNHFHTLQDIGWYQSAYGVLAAASIFSFGKLYTLMSTKRLYMISVAIFEIGSLLCTAAPTSKSFIVGRAIAGLGMAGIGTGSQLIVVQCFPRHKRPFWMSMKGGVQSIAMLSSPMIGGALIDWLSWRACFGINLPLGFITLILLHFGFQDLVVNPDVALPWKEKLKKFDAVGTFLMIPATVCLLVGLQWGGLKYGWSNARIIILFAVSAILLCAFTWRQRQLGENATLPPRVLMKKTVLAGAWFSICTNGTLAVTEYYISIYFQGVRGYTAGKSGFLMLPMLASFMVTTIVAGSAITWIGYYNPFMIATTVLAPIATGLLTTIKVEDDLVKVLCYIGFIGAAVGIGNMTPVNAIQNTISSKDLPIAVSILGFGGCLSSAFFICVSATLFQNRLTEEIKTYAPGSNFTQIEHAGLSEIRTEIGSDKLSQVLHGYDKAVTQTLYLPVALATATIFASIFTDWVSVKKKRA